MRAFSPKLLALMTSFALIFSAFAAAASGTAQAAAPTGPTALVSAADSPPANGPATVNVVLTDGMRLIFDRTSAPAGDVRFVAFNFGKVAHELVVLYAPLLPFDKLVANPEEPGKMLEQIHLGETGDVGAGQQSEFTLSLLPGTYTLLCNEPGHYMAGMRASFVVTEPIVTLSLANMKLTADRTSVVAGPVSFYLANGDHMSHRVSLLLTDVSESDVPTKTVQSYPDLFGVVPQALHLGGVRRFADLGSTSAGGLGILRLTLQPGRYVIACGEPGHYAAGMHLVLNVLPQPLSPTQVVDDTGGD